MYQFLAFAAGVIFGTSLTLAALLSILFVEPVCEKFEVAHEDEAGRVYLGYIELCGRDLEWGNIKGPVSRGWGDAT